MCCSFSDQCRWHTTNRFRYVYAMPVMRVVTRLRVLPRPRRGAQQVARTGLAIDPLPRAARSWIDLFGNCVVEVEHARLATHLEVTAELCVVATTAGIEALMGEGRPPSAPHPPIGSLRRGEEEAEPRALFLQATRLVDRSPEIEARAYALRRRCASDEDLAWESMRLVHQEMRYVPGSTCVATAASTAFAQRTGVCQDFAQVMLALCRAAGLPARYVSGHLEGEGQMHAWVEALYASTAGGPPAWHALDPTHDRAAAGSYVTVAVGRDYADVSPISGRCYGRRPGHLSSQQQTRRCLPEVIANDAGASRV
jgi:transglutaminase-like putative cysteine protease